MKALIPLLMFLASSATCYWAGHTQDNVAIVVGILSFVVLAISGAWLAVHWGFWLADASIPFLR